MSDPKLTWRAILAINFECAGGCLALFYGWLGWQAASPFWWGLWLVAIFGFVGGGAMILRALLKLGRLLWDQRRWRRFQAQGTAPRADALVSRSALKKRGLSE